MDQDEILMINPLNFTIETEVSPEYHGAILDFIYKYYLFPQPDRFSSIKNSYSKGLSFVLDSSLSDDKTSNGRFQSNFNDSKNHKIIKKQIILLITILFMVK